MSGDIILLNLVAFLAYFIKGITGFGGAIITVSVGTLLVGPYDAVILSAMYETIAGGILVSQIPIKKGRQFWFPLAVAMIGGTIVGGVLLKVIPSGVFEKLLTFFIFVFGVWFLCERYNKDESNLEVDFPRQVGFMDFTVSVIGGLSAGLVGTGGPPIAFWFGRRFGKHVFRGILIPVFLLSSIVRVITYGCIGLFNLPIVILTIYTLPGLILGTMVGNRVFLSLSERLFGRVLGIVLILVVLKLLMR